MIDNAKVIEEHLYLVSPIVQRLKRNLPAHIDADDLHSIGVLGLIKAVEKFDAAKGCTLTSYAAMRIRGALLDELRRMDWCPRRARAHARMLREAIIAVEQDLRRPATDAEVAEALGLSPKQYAKWVEEARPATFLCLDYRTESEEGLSTTLHELLMDEADVLGRERIEKEERLAAMVRELELLRPRTRQILAMYYFEGMLMQEIGGVFGLTESRIHQIIHEAFDILRGRINHHDKRTIETLGAVLPQSDGRQNHQCGSRLAEDRPGRGLGAGDGDGGLPRDRLEGRGMDAPRNDRVECRLLDQSASVARSHAAGRAADAGASHTVAARRIKKLADRAACERGWQLLVDGKLRLYGEAAAAVGVSRHAFATWCADHHRGEIDVIRQKRGLSLKDGQPGPAP